MPLYDYECSKCGRTTEVRHGFGETYRDPCGHCGGMLRRVFNPASIVFKGSGFYVTDSRKAAEARAAKAKPPAVADKSAASDKPVPAEKPATAKSDESAA